MLCCLSCQLQLPRGTFSCVCDGARLSRPPRWSPSPRGPTKEFRILSRTSRNSERRPRVNLYTDECTGDQQPVQNNNIAAVKSNNGGDADRFLQFSFVCSQANTTLARIKKLLQDYTIIFSEEEPQMTHWRWNVVNCTNLHLFIAVLVSAFLPLKC